MIFSIIFGIVVGSWVISRFFDGKTHNSYLTPPDDIFPKEEFDWEEFK